jgi:hypothetical protein
MRVHHLAILLGLTTAITSTQLPVQAATMTYQIQSGTTTLSLDEALSSFGLSSKVDFDILPPSNDPNFVGTDFTFSYDDQTKDFTPLSGTIEHTGSVAFDVDTTKLALLSPLEIGDFSLDFDEAGFFLQDNVSTGLKLFDIQINNAPTFDGTNLLIEGADVLVSQDFDTLLDNAAGYDVQVAGFKVGQAQVSATAVPEPETNIAVSLLLAGGMAVAIKRRHRAKKIEL